MDKQDSGFLFGKNGCPYARQKNKPKIYWHHYLLTCSHKKKRLSRPDPTAFFFISPFIQ
jgi:hypothetical protein